MALVGARQAAAQGHAGGQTNLGYMYANGYGVPQDYVQAHMWSILAATQGDKTARENRDTYAKQLPPTDVSKAQKLAREWWAAFKKQKGR